MGFSAHGREQLIRDELNAKSLKRRGSYFKRKVELTEAAKKEGIEIREAWPHQIKAIKEKLRAQKISERKQFYKAIIASVISAFILFFGIAWLIKSTFF